MLNKNGNRELAYVVKIGWVRPIEGADNIELVGINGWTCIARKGEFQPGDLAVYFEIDSKLPVAEWSQFMEAKHYKVKTMKLSKFKVISQGLALPADAFGWKLNNSGQFAGDTPFIDTGDVVKGTYFVEGDFLTSYLGVTYSVEEDNKRKAPSADKYKKMAQRHPRVFQKPFVKWLYKHTWGKKLLFVFFGKKKDARGWPAWVIKTDEERIENLPFLFEDKSEWFATEKVDGSSSTFTMKGFGKKREFYICSRNVCFNTPEKMAKGAYYDINIWQEMAIKYNIEQVLATLLDERKKELDFITIQGETYGDGVQKKTYDLKGRDLAIFNVIFGYKNGEIIRLNPREMTDLMSKYNLSCVPIISEAYVLPNTIEELRNYVNSEPSKIDGKIKEGIVFRSEDGKRSFKCVSPKFLLKFHQ